MIVPPVIAHQPLRRLSNNKFGLKGVYYDRRHNSYRASIGNPETGKRKAKRRFDRAEDAALAYDELAREFYGEAAILNFPTAEESKVLLGLQSDVGKCPSGHEYSTFGQKNGSRQINCRICNRAAAKRYKARRNHEVRP